jgi:hypothetical protein
MSLTGDLQRFPKGEIYQLAKGLDQAMRLGTLQPDSNKVSWSILGK